VPVRAGRGPVGTRQGDGDGRDIRHGIQRARFTDAFTTEAHDGQVDTLIVGHGASIIATVENAMLTYADFAL